MFPRGRGFARRAAPLAILVALGLPAAGRAEPAAPLTVLRAAHGSLRRGALVSGRSGVEAEIARQFGARADRWKGFPDFLGVSKIERSARVGARRGWTERLGRLSRAQGAAAEAGRADDVPPDTVHVAFIRIDFARDRGGAASSGNGRFDLSTQETKFPRSTGRPATGTSTSITSRR